MCCGVKLPSTYNAKKVCNTWHVLLELMTHGVVRRGSTGSCMEKLLVN